MVEKLTKNAQSIQDVLDKASLECKVLELPSSTRTDADAARTIGCNILQIVKSLIFKTVEKCEPILILVSGPNLVNEKQIEAYIGESVTKANAEFAREVTGFAIGGIPPIGHKHKIDLTFIDQHLMNFDSVWAAAGTPNAVFCIQSKDLLTVTNSKLIEVC